MKKKIFVSLAFAGLVAFCAFTIFGCSTGTTVTVTKDPGLIPSSEEATTISGSVSYDSSTGIAEVNLNAILVSGEALELESNKFQVYVGKSTTATSEWTSVEFTIPGTETEKPMDMVFILDNTGSMAGAITGSKNSINAFAASLEAGGADARFGLVTYGDSAIHPTPVGAITQEGGFVDGNSHERPIMDFGTAASLETVLAATYAEGGSDAPENPLDAIMYAYNNFTWRDGAQKIFVVITDVNAHQNVAGDTSSDNHCTTTGTQTVSALLGKAVVYAVSPDFTYDQSPYFDVRQLADGLGETRITPEANTGGKWIKFLSSGFDLTTLGISNIVTKGYTIRFSYSFSAGTWFIHILADTNGDGILDSDILLEITVTTTGGFSVPTGATVIDKKPYVPMPN